MKKKFKYSVYLTDEFINTEIEALDLSQRAYNVLRRQQIHLIGELINNIDTEKDLLKFRNCGENTAHEIMKKLFDYHYSLLDDEGKKKYKNKLEAMNK